MGHSRLRVTMASTRSPLCLSEGQGISFLQIELGEGPKVDEHKLFTRLCRGETTICTTRLTSKSLAHNVWIPQGHANLFRIF